MQHADFQWTFMISIFLLLNNSHPELICLVALILTDLVAMNSLSEIQPYQSSQASRQQEKTTLDVGNVWRGPQGPFIDFPVTFFFLKASPPLNGKHGEPAVYLCLKCKYSQNWIWFGSSGVARFLDDFTKTILGWSWALFRGGAGIFLQPPQALKVLAALSLASDSLLCFLRPFHFLGVFLLLSSLLPRCFHGSLPVSGTKLTPAWSQPFLLPPQVGHFILVFKPLLITYDPC